ncbi:hypothetical protein ES708_18325 [subsurface metagenome]
MIDAMKTFGLTAVQVAKKGDMMTYMARNSTIGLEDFATMVGYTDQEMVAAGLSIEDMAAMMMYMSDSGIAPGKVMLREWQAAVTKSKKENIAMTEALGMTNEELVKYRGNLENSEGAMQLYADAANEQFTIMDKLKQKWSELTLKMSGFLEPLEPILAGMTALGPLMLGLAMIGIPRIIGAIVALKGALFALAPYAAIAGVIAGFVALALGFGKSKHTTEEYSYSLEIAKTKLSELEETGQDTGETADDLRERIIRLTDAMREHGATLEDVKATHEEFQDMLEERVKLLEKVERQEHLLAESLEFSGQRETGWTRMRRDMLFELRTEYENLDKPIKDYIMSTEHLSEIYESLPDDLKEFADALPGIEELEKTAKLNEEFEAFIESVEKVVEEAGEVAEAFEFAQTEAGELGLTIDDLKKYMVAAGRENELLALSFEDWLELEGDVNRFADRFQLNLEDIARASGRTTEDMIQDARGLNRQIQDLLRDRHRAEIEAIDDRIAAERIAHQGRMDALRDEYDAAIKAVDAQLSYVLRGYQSQIDAIDRQMQEIEDARRQEQVAERKMELETSIAEEEDADRRADLEDRLDELILESGNELWRKERELAYETQIAEEKDADVRKALEKKLADFLIEVQRERTIEQLEDEKTAIRERMSLAEEEARESKKRIDEDYEYWKLIEEQKFEDFLTQRQKERDELDRILQEALDRYDADLLAFQEMLGEELASLETFVAAYNALVASIKDHIATITTEHVDVYRKEWVVVPGPAPPIPPAPYAPDYVPPEEAPPSEEEAREAAIAYGAQEFERWTGKEISPEEYERALARAKWEHFLGITPGLQYGGIAMRPLIAQIGEQAPRVPEAVIPLDRLEKMMGAKGKVNIYVELDGRVIAQAIGQPLVDEIRLRTGIHM